MNPKVSVVIPTFNRRAMLLQALDSVFAQTYQDYEVIVIDDGSTDGTGESVKSHYGERVRYIWQENQDRSAARNNGIRLAAGEYIALLDSDDTWLPEKLARQVPVLDANPQLGAVFCWAYRMDDQGVVDPTSPIGSENHPDDFSVEKMLLRNAIPGGDSTGLFRKDILEAVGGFDPQTVYGEEWDLGLRILSKAQMDCVPEPLVCIRLHPGAQSVYLDKDRISRRFKDINRTMDKLTALYPSSTHQDLIRLNRVRHMLKTGIAYLMIGEDLEARQLFQQVSKESPELMNDQQFWASQVIANGWMLFVRQKRLGVLEQAARSLLQMRRRYLSDGNSGFQEKLVWDRLYWNAILWLFQDGQSRSAWAAWWKWIRNRPGNLITSRGVKTTMRLIMGRTILGKLQQRIKGAGATLPAI